MATASKYKATVNELLPRKLASILHADVVGYSQLAQQDEEATHRRLRESLGEIAVLVKEYHGQVINFAGDAVLAMFDTTVNSVACAVAIQQKLNRRNANPDDGQAIQFRIGINLGDVILDGGDIYGDGVNVAARIQGLAEPGGICIADSVCRAVGTKLPLDYEDIGEQELKNITDPIRTFKVNFSSDLILPAPSKQTLPGETKQPVRGLMVGLVAIALVIFGGVAVWYNQDRVKIEIPVPEAELASTEKMAYPLPDKPSIAVLPFDNMSNDPEQEYFVDGMTEDIITDLSKLSGLFVIARNTVFTYKDKAVKISQVAEELGVKYVLEGSVRRAGDTVRINAQLIDAITGSHLWADRYDGSLKDVFALQDDVTKQIVAALAVSLSEESVTNDERIDPEAYDEYLKGWSFYQRQTVEGFIKSIPFLTRAVELNPNYGQAHATLAAIYWRSWQDRWEGRINLTMDEAEKRSRQHLTQALNNPTPLGHWVESNMLIADGENDKAVEAARKIVGLDENNADGYAQLAHALELAGNINQSTKMADKAARLDPFSSPFHLAAKNGDKAEVLKLIEEGMNLESRDVYGRTPLHIAAEHGQFEICRILVEAGADFEARMYAGRSPGGVWGATPLMATTINDEAEIAKYLIEAGADVNAKEPDYVVPPIISIIHYAGMHGSNEVAKLLVEAGVDVNIPADGGRAQTPLMFAAREGNLDTVDVFVSLNADVSIRDSSGATALFWAAQFGHKDTVDHLLESGANPNVRTTRGNNPGETALHRAAASGHYKILESLIAHGAEIDVVNQYGYTPLRRAVDSKELPAVRLLVNSGANVSTTDQYGISLLHIVAQTDKLDIAQFLLDSGIDVNMKDRVLGYTALDYAQDNDHAMIELIVEMGGICTICQQ